MNQYLYQLRPIAPDMLVRGTSAREQDVVEAHFAHLQRLLEEGVVLMAGRTTTEDENTFGIVILEAESEQLARQLMEADPAVAQGVMRAQLFPYRTALWSERGPRS